MERLFLFYRKAPSAEHICRMGIRRGKETFDDDSIVNLLGKTGKFSLVHLSADIFREIPAEPRLLSWAGGN